MVDVHTRVRPATPADYPAFVRFFAELGTGDAPLPEPRWRSFALPNSLFFERGRQTVGYCMFEVLSETGYIRHLVVAPEARGSGVGRAIMDELRRRFCAQRCALSPWQMLVKRCSSNALGWSEA
jgi:ribosomal protein S18 acetylase RimI-like enzyme